MTTRIAVVSAGLSQPSSTRLLADRLSAATVEALGERGIRAEASTIELRDLAHDVTDNLLTGFASPRLQAAIDSLTGADGVIAVTPIFTTSYSGLFKAFVDVLDPKSLEAMPLLVGATGGSERHSLALDYAIRPLFGYLRAATVPTAVYAASADWGTADSELAHRITRAASELADAVVSSKRVPFDAFALPEGFSPVGAFGAQ